ncbi:unnamed protein product, partial [Discosporangium mesarthrocarpum]
KKDCDDGEEDEGEEEEEEGGFLRPNTASKDKRGDDAGGFLSTEKADQERARGCPNPYPHLNPKGRGVGEGKEKGKGKGKGRAYCDPTSPDPNLVHKPTFNASDSEAGDLGHDREIAWALQVEEDIGSEETGVVTAGGAAAPPPPMGW